MSCRPSPLKSPVVAPRNNEPTAISRLDSKSPNGDPNNTVTRSRTVLTTTASLIPSPLKSAPVRYDGPLATARRYPGTKINAPRYCGVRRGVGGTGRGAFTSQKKPAPPDKPPMRRPLGDDRITPLK